MQAEELDDNFTLWLLTKSENMPGGEINQSHSKAYESLLEPILTFGTVKQFWEFFPFLVKPSQIKEKQMDIYLFREGVKPLWEHPLNKEGSYYSLSITPEYIDLVWQNAVLTLIAPNTKLNRHLNGVRVKVHNARQAIFALQVWMCQSANQCREQLKTYLKESLQIEDELQKGFILRNFKTKLGDFISTKMHIPSGNTYPRYVKSPEIEIDTSKLCIIINDSTDKVLDTPNRRNATRLIIYNRHGGPNQKWYFHRVGEKGWAIYSTFSLLCMDIFHRHTNNNTKVIQYERNEGKHQLWFLKQVGKAVFKICSLHADYFLSVNSDGQLEVTYDDTPMAYWRFEGTYPKPLSYQ